MEGRRGRHAPVDLIGDVNFPTALYTIAASRRHPNSHASEASCDIMAERQRPAFGDAAARGAAALDEGRRLLRAKDFTAAVPVLRRAAELRPRDPMALLQYGLALEETGADADARDCWRQALRREPDLEPALLLLAKSKRSHCDWDGLDGVDRALDRATAKTLAAGGCPLEGPFFNQHRQDDPPHNRALAEAWARLHAAKARELPPPPSAPSGRPLRLGYLCGQWYAHPVMQCMGFVMRAHDRDRFTVVGFDYGPERDDPFRRRALAAVDQHVRLDLRRPDAAAQAIRAHAIDILVDLTGHTEEAPLAILACRPARVQLSYFGFIGTSGAAYIDGLVTDRTLAAANDAAWYAEPLLHLPESFLAMGPAAEADEVPTSRAEQGLPEDALVLASFNGAQKLDPALFDHWLEILRDVPAAVLWQLAEPAAGARLKARAARRGIDPGRLVIAPKVNYFHHLARIRLADLALDTHPYGGGVTSIAMLWAGVPIVTLAGRHAGSRMTASILRTAGLGELVTESHTAYRRLAIDLATDADRRRALKERLARTLPATSLLDPSRFARQLETVFRQAGVLPGASAP